MKREASLSDKARRFRAAGLLLLSTMAVLLLAATLAPGDGLTLERVVIGGGGGHAEGNGYVVDATIGQAVVAVTDAEPYELCVGFWCAQSPYELYIPLLLREHLNTQ
jgi:hypothetical protein